MRRSLFLLFVALLTVAPLLGQSGALKTKRTRLLRELAETNERLAATQQERGAAVGRATLLRSQIEQRRELIRVLREEVERNRRRMHRDSTVIVSLNADLDRMRGEYAAALRSANRGRLNYSWLSFLLSADGLNDAFRRLAYLRQYRSFRSRQGRAIRQTREVLNDRLYQLSFQRIEQDSLLAVAQDQGATLAAELVTQTELVDRLSTSERKLLERVRRQRREGDELARRISQAIASSIREERSREVDSPREPAAAVSGIAARRGRLAWPARGTIARRFGSQPHPDVPSVIIKNSGIDIEAGGGTPVAAIFAGKVISNREVPGFRNTLMIKHGTYYTVYSNLDRTSVRTGQEVQAGDQLGFTSPSGDPLHFEIWRGRNPLNPERWLAK